MRGNIGPLSMRSKLIPLSEPCLKGNEWGYVKDCLDSGWVSSVGDYVRKFEEMVANRCGAEHAVATVNGTSALHIALLLAGVKNGDEVLVPDLTFVATANVVRYLQAWPVFVDCEHKHWQMNPETVASFLKNDCERKGDEMLNRTTGRRVSAIMPVHVLGHPSDMDTLCSLAAEYNLPVVEDATESLGTCFAGQSTGTFGIAGCFSFNGNKILTTGAGGMLVTNKAGVAEDARHLTTQAKCHSEEYIHDSIGFNYRLSNVLAAIGCAQMESLDAVLRRKSEVAAKYREDLASCPEIGWQDTHPRAEPNHWLPTMRLLQPGKCVRKLRRFLGCEGIQTRCVWQPMHLNSSFAGAQKLGSAVATSIYETALSLPSSVHLTESQQEDVIAAIIRGLSRI
jgi:perosamine synthetase